MLYPDIPQIYSLPLRNSAVAYINYYYKLSNHLATGYKYSIYTLYIAGGICNHPLKGIVVWLLQGKSPITGALHYGVNIGKEIRNHDTITLSALQRQIQPH